VKNVSAHKTDVLDCQWLQQLGTFGLIKVHFAPQIQILPTESIALDNVICLLKALLPMFAYAKKALTIQMKFTLHK